MTMRQNMNNIPGGNLMNFPNDAAVRTYLGKQIRRKGFTFTAGVGNNSQALQLPGDGKILLGIVLYDDSGDPTNQATLKINSAVIIEDVSHVHLCRVFGDPAPGGTPTAQSNPYVDEYFPVMWPLTQNDDIQLSYQAGTAASIFIEFVYV